MKLEKLHEDKRGSIFIITGFKDYEEATLFKTIKGFARGGCIHYEHDEFFVVIEGQVALNLDGDKRFLFPGDCVRIPQATPHYLVALTDCVVMEWGVTAEEKKDKHPKTRKIVDEINDKSN